MENQEPKVEKRKRIQLIQYASINVFYDPFKHIA